MDDSITLPPLKELLPPLILGGAGFSYQCHPDPSSLPISLIIKEAFDNGLHAIDTSPYYEPSEELLGQALAQPQITDSYSRSDYVLMTKVGRISADKFDYTPAWVRQSVERSLERFRTDYLDVVFCHDVEFVTDEDAIGAVGELLEFVRKGKLRYIGISGYRNDILAHLALKINQIYGRPVDIIQTWGQMTLQNSKLESEGLAAFGEAGVSCVCASSPLAIGLLRNGGVPVGKRGDFHPAPAGLRKAAQDAADHTLAQGESLAGLALRYSLWRAQASDGPCCIFTITGISTITELEENVETARKLLEPRNENEIRLTNAAINKVQLERDQPLFHQVQMILGDWMNYSFTSPPEGWSRELKATVS